MGATHFGLTSLTMGEHKDELTRHGGSRDDEVVPQALQERDQIDQNKAEGNLGFPEEADSEE